MAALDSRIKSAQRKNAFAYIFLATFTLLTLVGFALWFFVINVYVLVVGPQQASTSFSTTHLTGLQYLSGDKLYVFGDKAIFSVSAPSYETVSVEITPNTPRNIEIILPPSPAVIQASLDFVQMTSWFVDDNLVHVGNELSYQLDEGSYRLRAEHPFYEPWKSNIRVAKAETLFIEPEFKAVSGSISLAANHHNANVLIEGKPYSLPISLDVKGGKYDVVVSKAGYQTISDTVSVTFERSEQTRNYNLQPEQTTLLVNTTPSDGVLLINGTVSPVGAVKVNTNQPVDVRYSKPGYQEFAQTVSLNGDESTTLNIVLNEALAEVSVSSNVKAAIFINGVNAGETPYSGTLPAIDTTFELRKAGYRNVSRKVTVRADTTNTIDFVLQTEFAAQRAEGLPTIASKLGIVFQRFQAGLFKMGSEINEIGRRRNEHPVNVNLNTPFWVSVHEITQAQFSAFNSGAKPVQTQSKQPQTNISWLDAVKFTNWLSEQDGLPAFYRFQGDQYLGFNPRSAGYRLLTEAEWEWLAKQARRQVATTYVWGNAQTIPKKAGNFADKSRKSVQALVLDDYDDGMAGVAEIGSFNPDRVGLHDLAGNVSEWVHDFYTNATPNHSDVYIDYTGAQNGDYHVVKGGNYATGRLRDLRAAFREPGAEPSETIGFRIARYAITEVD